MPIGEMLGKLLGGTGSGVTVRQYECDDCESTFESAKQPDRSQCPECLSNETTALGTVDRD